MKIILVSLSGRKKGTSNMLLHYFEERLTADAHEVKLAYVYGKNDNNKTLLDQMKWSDTIVMIGPTYVDSYPADTIKLLEEMKKSKDVMHGQSLYGFIQGGMPYVHTHEQGIVLLHNFADRENLIFKGGFVMGGGAMLDGQSLDKIIGAKKMVPAIEAFIHHISKNEVSLREEYTSAQMKMPVVVTWGLSKVLSHAVDKQIKKLGVMKNHQSPYRVTGKEVNPVIRKEEEKEYHETEAMAKRAFWNLHVPGCDEHYLVHLLRNSSDYIPELSRVAYKDGRVVGTILYAKAYVEDQSGNKEEVLTFGPLCVDPLYQNQGIGGMLLEETMGMAKDMGYKAIIIFGEPDYYPRHGFSTCDKFGITTAEGKNFPAFMGIELKEGSLKNMTGHFVEPAVYSMCEPSKVDEFDKNFLYLPKLKLPGQWS